ncbi:MAG TPA: hypothetical protein VFY57_05415, partial [Rubrobacteraceae bacterium]|nr:hypothetical protein [Rubrobacteraceae bacterium]
PSIMDKVNGDAAYHLISVGQLVFDDIAEVGEGGKVLGDISLVGLAIRLLARGQATVDEVRGE